MWLVSWFSVSFGGYLYGCICCHSILEGQNLAKVIDLIVPCFSTSWQLIVCSYTDHPDASGPATHHHAQPNQMSDYFSEKVSDSRTKSDSNAHVKTSSIIFIRASPNKKNISPQTSGLNSLFCLCLSSSCPFSEDER